MGAGSKFLGSSTDHSGSIAAGGTAQDVIAANEWRLALTFQNLSDTAMYVRDDGTDAAADSGSWLVAANGGSFQTGGNGRVSVYCVTTGKKFTAKEY